MENGCDFIELIDKAVYFARLNRLVDSREILQLIPAVAYNQNYYLAHALCCIGYGNHPTAIRYLESIDNLSDHKVLKLLLKCYEKLNDNVGAATVYQRMNPKNIKQTLWIKMFECYQALGEEHKIHEIYSLAIHNFPSNLDLRYKYVEHLLVKNYPGFLMVIDDYIKKWPFHIRFHILKIKHALKHNRHVNLEHYLLYVLHEYPFIMESNYLMMQYYLLIQMPLQVKLYQRACVNRMNGLLNLSLEFEVFNSTYTQLTSVSILECPKQVTLPSVIIKGFEACQFRDGACFLVGSVVHNLLDDRPLVYSQDLDFVSNIIPKNISFVANPHRRNLYITYIPDEFGARKKLDYFVGPYATENFLQEDFLNRDFTMNALYVDSLGNVSDPTGLGYHDYQHKTLRTIELPRKSLAQDPSRILRAIKLMAQGYHPVDELNYALANWLPNANINYNHIHFVTRKIMYTINPLDFVYYLKHYNLLSKLYFIPEFLSDKQALFELNQRIQPCTQWFFTGEQGLSLINSNYSYR